MLSSIKNKTKGPITFLIVGLISLTFIVTALYGIDFNGGGATVAIVNDDEITSEDFYQEFNTKKRRLQQELGEQYTTEFDQILKQSTLDAMVNRRLLAQLSNTLGHATTKDELKLNIQNNELFQQDGKFSFERYQQLLRLNGYNENKYESVVADEMTQNQLKQNLRDSAFIAPVLLKRVQSLNDQQRKFDYLVLNADNYLNKVKVDEASVKEYFDNQKESFFEAEKVSADFVELSLDEVVKSVSVTEEALFNHYEDEQSRYTTEQERQAQHILVETLSQAEEVTRLLNQGEQFSTLSAKYSIDEGSKDNSGDLGFFGRGVMVPEFEEAVFAMQVGEVSQPIKSEFGYHIIKLMAINPGTVKPFEEVRDELTKRYTQQIAQKQLYDLVDQLANLAYEGSLEELSEQMGLAINTTDLFSRSSTQYDQKFVAAAFSDVVLNKSENSEPIELAKDKFVVLRLNKKIPQRQQSFSEVKTQISNHLGALLAKTFVDKVASKIKQALVAGNEAEVKSLMTKNELKWHKVDWIERDSNKLKAAIVNKVFALAKPEKNTSTYDAQSLSDKESIVFKLTGVKSPENQASSALSNTLLDFESGEVFAAILKMLHQNSEIQTFTERL